MGAVATAALTGGKGHMETELAKLLTNPLMTFDADITVPFGQEPFLLRVMGKVAGKTVTLGGRGMGKGPLAILPGPMAFGAQRCWLGK